MNFTYDFANGTTEIVYHPEKKRIPDPEMVEKINRCVYLLNIKVRPGNEGAFAYNIKGKTNFLAWQSEASEKARHEMEGQIADGLNGCMSMGISAESVVQEKRYMYVDDRTQRINFICIPGLEDKPAKAAKKNQENIYELETPPLPDTIPEPRSEEIYEPFGNNRVNRTEERYAEIKPMEEEKQEYVSIIENNNTLLLQLISDILDLSKIEAGTLDFNYSNVEINDLMSDLKNSCQLKLKSDKVKLEFIAPEQPCCAYIEKNRLSQLIINFVTNAIKFTTEGSIRFGFYILVYITL